MDTIDQSYSSSLSSNNSLAVYPHIGLTFSIKLNQNNLLIWQKHLLAIICAFSLEKYIHISQSYHLYVLVDYGIPNI